MREIEIPLSIQRVKHSMVWKKLLAKDRNLALMQSECTFLVSRRQPQLIPIAAVAMAVIAAVIAAVLAVVMAAKRR
jgi:hypothetical protein